MSSTLPNLKPMSTGDILDYAIRIYRQNFVGLVTIVGIVTLPFFVLQAIGYALVLLRDGTFSAPSTLQSNPALPLPLLLLSLVLTILLGFFAIFKLGATASFVSERFLGHRITVWQAYKNAFGHGLSLFVDALLLVLAYVGVLSLLIGVVFVPVLLGMGLISSGGNNLGSGGAPAGAGVVICLFVLLIPTIMSLLYLYAHWTFWSQAIMLENYSGTGALGRSWKLVKGTFWRVLLFNVLLTIFPWVISFSASAAVSWGSVFLPNLGLRLILQLVVSGIINVIIAPLQYAALTILYYDLRIRKEGFDLQMQLPSLTLRYL